MHDFANVSRMQRINLTTPHSPRPLAPQPAMTDCHQLARPVHLAVRLQRQARTVVPADLQRQHRRAGRGLLKMHPDQSIVGLSMQANLSMSLCQRIARVGTTDLRTRQLSTHSRREAVWPSEGGRKV